VSRSPAAPLSHGQARLCVVLAAVLWSLNGAFKSVLTQPTALGLHEPPPHADQIAFFRLLFAGLVLLFTRPYVAGERIVVRSGAVNGPLTGTVVGVGLLYTTLAMEDGPTNIPNSALVAAAVGPAPVEDGEPSQK